MGLQHKLAGLEAQELGNKAAVASAHADRLAAQAKRAGDETGALGRRAQEASLQAEMLGTKAQLAGKQAEEGAARAHIGWQGLAMGVAAAGLAISVAVGGIAVESVRAGSAFEEQMLLLHTQAGLGTKDVEELSKAVLNLAPAVGIGPEALSKGLYHVASIFSSLKPAEMMDVLKLSAQGASMGMADLETMTNAVGASMVNRLKDVHSASDAMSLLNAVVGAGNLRMQDLASAMGTGILSAASTFGLSLRDVGAALATLTAQGMPAEEAATRLRMSFSLMAAPTAKATAELKTIGITHAQLGETMRSQGLIPALQLLHDHLQRSGMSATQQADVISKAFGGGRSSAAIMGLLNNLDLMNEKATQIDATTGTFGEKLAAHQDTLAFKQQQLNAAWQSASTAIGMALLPLLTQLLTKILPIVTAISQWVVAHQGLAMGILVAVAAFGTLIMVLGTIALIAPLIGGAFTLMFGPVGIIIVAIALLAAGFIYLYTHSRPFHDFVNALAGAIRVGLVTAFNFLRTVIEGIGPFFSRVGTIIREVQAAIGGFFSGLGSAVSGAISAIGGFFSGLGTMAHGVVTAIGGFFSGLGSAAHNAVAAVGAAFSALGTFVHNQLMRLLNLAEGIWREFSSRPLYWIGFLIVAVTVGLLTLYQRVLEWATNLALQGEHAGAGLVMRFLDWARRLPGETWNWLVNTWDRWVTWRNQMYANLGEWVTQMFTRFRDWLSRLPSELWNWLQLTWARFNSWRILMYDELVLWVTTSWARFVDFLSRLPGEFQHWFGQVRDNFADWAGDMISRGLRWASDFRDTVIRVIRELPGLIAEVAGRIGGQVENVIKNGVNAIAGGLNSFDHGVNDALHTFGIKLSIPDIPRMASGGVVGIGPGFRTGGPVAVVGEGDGHEYVIPAGDPKYRARAIDLWLAAGKDMQMFASGGVLGQQKGGIPTSGVGGECVVFAENVLGVYWPVYAAAELAAFVNSQVARAGEAAVFTGGPFGHVAVVTGPGDGYSFPVIDSNWVASQMIGQHVMNRGMYGFAGFIDTGKSIAGLPAGGGPDPGKLLGGLFDKAKTAAAGLLPHDPAWAAQFGGAVLDKLAEGARDSIGGWVAGLGSNPAANLVGHAFHALIADAGAVTLRPGLNAVYNGTGGAEALVSPSGRSEQLLNRLVSAVENQETSSENHFHINVGGEELQPVVERVVNRRLSRLTFGT